MPIMTLRRGLWAGQQITACDGREYEIVQLIEGGCLVQGRQRHDRILYPDGVAILRDAQSAIHAVFPLEDSAETRLLRWAYATR